jgi:septal ring factor EnvC (AmiA/AmiB activator)
MPERPRADRSHRTGLAAALAALLAFGLAAPGAQGQASREKLDSVEKSLQDAKRAEQELSRKAGALERDVKSLQQRSVAIAARAQEQEETLTRLESELRELQATEAAAAARLTQGRTQLAGVLAALQRLARHPPVALAALPTSPTETVRSAILLRAAVPAIEARATRLRDDLRVLGEVRDAMAGAREKLTAESERLKTRQTELAALVARKSDLAGRTREESLAAGKRAETLGQEAQSLRELLARIAEERRRTAARREAERREAERRRAAMPAPAPAPPIKLRPPKAERAPQVAALGPLGLPARGTIRRKFGGDDEFGQPARGISVKTRSNAQVVSPRAGEIVFAGPFRGFGQLLIIEHGAEYHVLLAGMARIDATVGDKVMAGEPVGIMGSGGTPEPILYLELRRKGRPVDPLPWLAAGRTEVNG